MQSALKEQQLKGDSLSSNIKGAAKRQILNTDMQDLAHEIRTYGNNGAHPNKTEAPATTKEAAELTLELLRILIKSIYEIPAEVARIKEKHAEARRDLQKSANLGTD